MCVGVHWIDLHPDTSPPFQVECLNHYTTYDPICNQSIHVYLCLLTEVGAVYYIGAESLLNGLYIYATHLMPSVRNTQAMH